MATILPLSEPVPTDATDFAVGIATSGIAWISNRVVTLLNGDCVAIPPGWEAAVADDGFVIIYYDHTVTREVLNA